ncbi:MAG: uracil phosphoribosyltransferase [Flavobacteriaceae bacterium]|nr:uracil phosphoribosyltransferase [Flavobacteriaceae bacterium]MCB0486458.1 uracil phosphoribosyltransferase [Flavobacteriaceae bacterium]
MIANNIFRAIGDFFTNILFIPYDAFRSMDGWWISNAVNVVLVIIGFIALFYWLGQLSKFKRTGDLS